MNKRRDFIKKVAITGAGVAVVPNLAFGISNGRAADKLRIGLIGVGLRGTNHLNNALRRDDVLITAICDIDSRRISIALDEIEKAGEE
jgi:predicted homoserine dehydrogenase-like protein